MEYRQRFEEHSPSGNSGSMKSSGGKKSHRTVNVHIT
jgi:hypothetical protein